MKHEILAGIFVVAFCATSCKKQDDAAVNANVNEPMAVAVTEIEVGTNMKETLQVQGSLRSKDAAAVSARVPGTIDEIKVDEGAHVNAGDVLFTIDQVNLRNALQAAKDDLTIAQAKKAEAEAALDKATKDRDRLKRLVERNAVTEDADERAELQYKTAAAALQAVEATITKATTGIGVAEKNLADSVIVAPFEGILTTKLKNVGDYAGPGTPVFYLENTAVHEITCALNSDVYAKIAKGETKIVPANPASLEGRGFPVTYKAATVNKASRTFEVRAEVPMNNDMVSGMIIDATIVTREFSAATLPVSALAFRDEKWVAYAIQEGKTVGIEAKRGTEYKGRVEILNPEAFTDQVIVESGILLLNEGDSVRTK